ncbi:hypothetical protein ACFL15_01465 [Patescibacteria group bacterium]
MERDSGKIKTTIEVFFNGEWRSWNVEMFEDSYEELGKEGILLVTDDDSSEIFIRMPFTKKEESSVFN